MNLNYAVERLYETGWSPSFSEQPCDALPDGRRFPSVADIQRQFVQAGLELSIKHNLMFGTYRATWTPNVPVSSLSGGTVIGSSECEAAVYALAQLRESQEMSRLTLA